MPNPTTRPRGFRTAGLDALLQLEWALIAEQAADGLDSQPAAPTGIQGEAEKQLCQSQVIKPEPASRVGGPWGALLSLAGGLAGPVDLLPSHRSF